jgi:hypothetical protein
VWLAVSLCNNREEITCPPERLRFSLFTDQYWGTDKCSPSCSGGLLLCRVQIVVPVTCVVELLKTLGDVILWLLGHKDRLQSFESWLQGLGIGDFAATDKDHLLGLRLESGLLY